MTKERERKKRPDCNTCKCADALMPLLIRELSVRRMEYNNEHRTQNDKVVGRRACADDAYLTDSCYELTT